MGKGNPLKKIIAAPAKLLKKVTGVGDMEKMAKRQEEGQKKQIANEKAEAEALEAKRKSDEEFNRKTAQEVATMEQNRKNSALNNLSQAGMDDVQTDFSRSAITGILKDKEDEDDLLQSFRGYR